MMSFLPDTTTGSFQRTFSGLAAGPTNDSGTVDIVTCP
jgi:hypothetical protein